MKQFNVRILTFLFVLAATVPTARAADDLNLSTQRFLPSPHTGDYLSMMSSHVRDTLDFNVGLMLNWSAETMRFKDAGGDLDELIEGRLTGDLLLSMSFFEYISLGIDLPIHALTTVGDENPALSGGAVDRGDLEGFGIGDLRISTKIRILDAKKTLFGVAIAADVTVPTGKQDAFSTDDGVTVMPRLILDLNIKGYRGALNVGYRYRPDYELRWLEVEPEFFLGAAVGIPLIEHNLELIGELDMTTKTADFFGDDNTTFMEGRAAIQYVTDFGLGVTVGGGGGFFPAYGSPLYRVFAGVNYAPRHIVRDLDSDGIEDEDDQCPTDPEDMDSFQDADGCPDIDNDKDTILDVNDKCPMKAEDKDGFEDKDGCPDPDNDGDGILDVDDACPMKAEDKDGFEDADGCPELDNDKDGILDTADKCPMEPEDMDGCIDDDGCPEPGNVCVTKTEIKILQKVYFKTNRSTIKKESYPILDEVATVLIQNPDIKLIEVQGHTDDRGRDKKNLKLSQKRAQAVVKYLIKAGVDKSRFKAKGYGETTPIDTNETEEGRANNRRVEFHILERDAPADGETATEVKTAP